MVWLTRDPHPLTRGYAGRTMSFNPRVDPRVILPLLRTQAPSLSPSPSLESCFLIDDVACCGLAATRWRNWFNVGLRYYSSEFDSAHGLESIILF